MKVVIFGATGGTGRPLVEQALALGHTVTAFVRSPAAVNIQHERLSVVQGDVRDPTAVEHAVKGQDAVISVIGPRRGSNEHDVMVVGTQNILSAMQKHGIRRFIAQSGAGVVDPRDEPSRLRPVVRALLKLFARNVLADAERQYALVKNSGLAWTLVRVPRLVAGTKTGKYQVSFKPPKPTPVTRGDIADFMLKQLDDQTYLQQAPMIGY